MLSSALGQCALSVHWSSALEQCAGVCAELCAEQWADGALSRAAMGLFVVSIPVQDSLCYWLVSGLPLYRFFDAMCYVPSCTELE